MLRVYVAIIVKGSVMSLCGDKYIGICYEFMLWWMYWELLWVYVVMNTKGYVMSLCPAEYIKRSDAS